MRNYYDGKKRIGWYKPEQKTFRKVVNKEKHLLKLFDAWGIQSTVINDLAKRGCDAIRIKETTENKIYAISLEDFLAYSVERDLGAGKQLFASRKHFNILSV